MPAASNTFTKTERLIVFAFATAKLLIHFLTNTNYSLHRDEFLYLDDGNHLDWGFVEVPPLMPFLGKIFTSLAGDSVFGVRLLPAVVGVVIIFLIARIVKELGGGKWGIIFACTAFLSSLAFLRTNTLFQPVCLDQMWWVVVLFLALLIVKYHRRHDYLFLGVAGGLAWMTKYSIVFIVIALLLGVLITKQRKHVSIKYLMMAFGIAFAIALPNLIWQYAHNFPVVQHMDELSQTQLVHVSPFDFLKNQILMQFAGVFIWLPGVFWLLFSRQAITYRFLGWTYLFLIGLLLVLSGKDYYTLGVYPVMMAAGGVALEKWIRNSYARYALIAIIALLNTLVLPMGLPILSMEKLVSYCKTLESFGVEQRWEDGEKYPIPQDYADMQGWEEPVATVAKHYHALPDEKKKTCLIFGAGYAHVGPLNYHREKYDLPEARSLDASYIFWIPDSIKFDNMFLVVDELEEDTPLFYRQELLDSTRNAYARDPGYVYYRSDPKPGMDSVVVEIIRMEKARFKKAEAKPESVPPLRSE